MYKKKTLRNMQPKTRRYARIINDLDSVTRRLHNLTEEIGRLEADSRALFARKKQVDPEILPGRIHWEKAAEIHVQHDPFPNRFDPRPEDLLPQQQEAADEL